MGSSDSPSGGNRAAGRFGAFYRNVWRASLTVFLMLGVVAAVPLSAQLLGIALLMSLLAGLTAATLYDANATARWTTRQVVTGAAGGAAVITLALGLAAVLGPNALWLVVLLGLTSPPVVQWCGGMWGLGTVPGRRDVPERSTADLCRQWRDSYEALRHARTDAQRLRIVMERQRCLDELDRRDPEGLQAWLASAASAAGDPARFLKN